jgi:hypothetical protein
MDRIFVHLPGDEGSTLINIHQIVQTGDMSDDALTLHMSNGHQIVVNGKEMVKDLLSLLCDHTIHVDGKRMHLSGVTGDEITEAEPSNKS